MRPDRKTPLKTDKKAATRSHKRGIVGYNKKTALLEDAITQMNTGKYGRSSAALKELLALDPHNMEARRLFATLHLRLGSLIPARQAFDSLINEAFDRQDFWLAESLLREYLAAGPRCVPYIEKLGSVYERKGNANEAVAEYGKAIDLLIEDPDPDNPHQASQLYAKIKELAPANPIVFRFASCFDAHTGELVAGPPAAHGEVAVAPPSTSLVEETPSSPSIPEPMTGVMPWEQLEDAPEAMPFAPVHESVRSTETPVPQEVPTVPSQEANALVDRSPAFEPFLGKRSDSTLDVQPEGQGEAQEEGHLCSSAGAPAPRSISGLTPDDSIGGMPLSVTSDAPPKAVVPNVLDEAPATLRESESNHTLESEFTSSPLLASQAHDGPSLHTQQGTGTEPIAAPMPWEDILESIITIPDHLSNGSSTPANQAEGTPIAAPSDLGSAVLGPDEPREVAPSAPVVDEPTQIGLVTEEPVVKSLEPISTQPPGNVFPEPEKSGKFSWESVFKAAWKFGDKPASDEPQPEAAQVDTTHIEEPPPSTISSLQGESSEVDPIDIPETARVPESPDPAAASVVAPMPWDQVQDSIVTIPSAEVEEAVADLSIDQSVQSARSAEPGLALSQEASPDPAQYEPSDSPTGAVPVTKMFSTAEAPPDLSISEPEFRFASSTYAPPVQEGQISNVDMASTPFAVSEGNESESLMPVEPETPGFTNVSAVPTASELVPSGRAPVAITTSMDTTSAAAPVADFAPGETQPASMFSPLTGVNDEPLPTPSAVGTEQPAGDAEPTAPEANPGRMSAVSAQDPSRPAGDRLHSKTGEAMGATRPPASKKRQRASAPEPEITLSPVSSEETPYRRAEQSQQQDAASVEARTPLPPEPVPRQEEWISSGETIRFVEQPKGSAVVETAPQARMQPMTGATQSMSAAAAAVDVLFDSPGDSARKGTREHAVDTKSRPKRRPRLNRIGTGVSAFLGSCFSTTRSIVMSLVALVVLSGALMALAIGAVGLTWVIMEKPKSPVFQNLTASSQRTLSDPKKNGYLLLLGFDAPADQDPIQAGYERKPDPKEADMALACLGAIGGGQHGGQSNASASVAGEWFRGPNPVGQFKSHQDAIKGWVSKGGSALGRYKQWQRLSFEDWGYGQAISPPCASILFSHQLYLADGFLQGEDIGIDRIETDMEAWRIALGQAKTLPVKTLAIQAITDDIAVASGLLVQPDFDGRYVGRLAKMLRPLDQVELSIRWPMQSELVSATKTFEAQLKAERREEQTLAATVASALPLPKQRRFNAYAEYYEASYKAAGEGRHGSLPKWKNYIQFPPSTVMDYFANPIENIVGLEPLAPWDLYNGLVVDTDARLRLASLQAWLRRGPQDADLLARIAKAGQNFYDPYTGLPMLVNLKKGVMYSVGHDGKDQDADPQFDVVVSIPLNPSLPAGHKASSGSSKSK